MGLFGKSNGSAAPKHRSLFGAMYNPNIGASIRPIGQSIGMFTKIIAMIFAMNGLFPKNHPLLSPSSEANLGFGEVINTAWSRLSFTKTGIPKVILFFSVVGCLLCLGLSVISILYIVFLGHAHAATSVFVPANTQNDLGWNLIDYLFSPTNSAAAFANISNQYGTFAGAGSVMPNSNIQTAMWTALGYYSNALLIFGGFILFYHLASMVVNTAHSGVVMGKQANQVWAPIRLAVAVILLVPVSNQLNSGQLIVMQMAQWGSGLASNVWDIYRASMMNGGQPIATPTAPNISNVVTNVAAMAACEYRVNYELYQAALNMNSLNATTPWVVGWSNNFAPGTAWDAGGVPQTPDWQGANPPLVESLSDGSTIYHFGPNPYTLNNQDMCGSYTIPGPPTYNDPQLNGVANSIYNAQIAAFTAILPEIMAYGANEQYYICSDPDTKGACGTVSLPDMGQISQITREYQNNLATQINAATVNITAVDKYTGAGWLAAGAFFNQAAHVQAVMSSAASSYVPITRAPTNALISQFIADMKTGSQVTPASSLPPIVLTSGGGCPATNVDSSDMGEIMKSAWHTRITDILLKVTDILANQTGVWCAGDGSLGVHFTGTEPLHQMANWGLNNLELGTRFWDWGLGLMVAGGLAASSQEGLAIVTAGGVATTAMSLGASSVGILQKIFGGGKSDAGNAALDAGNTMAMPADILLIATFLQGGATDLGAMLLPIGSVFFTLGFLFGFMLPLLPFMHFFFGTITWIAILFEAVFAMPLVALAHITPEGEGLPGGYAKTAYFMAFSILLRPALMIFGLIAGFMLLTLAVTFLNMFYATALSYTGGTGSHVVLGKLLYTIIYCIIIISVANHVFQLITLVPDKMMGWIGQHSATGPAMGSPEKIINDSSIAAGYLSNRVMTGIGNSGVAIKNKLVEAREKGTPPGGGGGGGTGGDGYLGGGGGTGVVGSGSGGGGNLGGGGGNAPMISADRGSAGEPIGSSPDPKAGITPTPWMDPTGKSNIPAATRKANALATDKAKYEVDWVEPTGAEQAAVDAYRASKNNNGNNDI